MVLKIKDALAHLSACQLDRLQEIGETIADGRRNMGIEYEAPLSAADGIGCPGCGIQPPVSGTRADTCCTVRNVYAEEIKVPMTLRSNAELCGERSEGPLHRGFRRMVFGG